jgi:hypothetical protein
MCWPTVILSLWQDIAMEWYAAIKLSVLKFSSKEFKGSSVSKSRSYILNIYDAGYNKRICQLNFCASQICRCGGISAVRWPHSTFSLQRRACGAQLYVSYNTGAKQRIGRCSYDGRTNCSNGIISLVANTRILKYSQNLRPSTSFTPSHAKQTFVSSQLLLPSSD